MTATAILDLERAGLTREQVKALAYLSETQIANTKSSLLVWMFGIAAGQLSVLFTFLRLSPGGHP